MKTNINPKMKTKIEQNPTGEINPVGEPNNLKVNSKSKVIETFYIDCPICSKEIKGSSKVHTLACLKLHFNIIHPKLNYSKIVGKLI